MAGLLIDGPDDAAWTLLLAHGAGAPMDSAFMAEMARLIAENGLRVLRIEFPYMAARREDGRRRPPPGAERLVDHFLEAAADAGGSARLLIGGKSLGGRVASLCADALYSDGLCGGLVCLGYPFHPPGRPERLRTAQLETLACPALICQGERDPFGGRTEAARFRLSPAIEIHWLADGDHDLRPRKASGRTAQDNWQEAADAVARFAERLEGRRG